jgi:3-phenylpropionate/cinnamic acid dioxygenase small subunit
MEVLPTSSALYQEALQFLIREAELLDERRWEEWLELLTDDIRYRMPVRVTKEHTLEKSVLQNMDHFDENRYSLEKRVERLGTEYAWAEDPPSRTRHFVSNVRVYERAEEELLAKSYVLLFRSRGDTLGPDLLSAERIDVLRRVDGELKLANREILVDESVLRTQNLAIFL